ncbi:MAG TPA: glycoside hydrolase domain-containing protein [Gemmatimonadaceae bacterium]|nr:glycoside hydrolase domain-containing protein [Gemmatimonadaceae bacterium]
MKKQTLRNALLVATAAVSAWLESPKLVHEPLPAAAAELAAAPATIDSAVVQLVSTATRSHLGFDTNVYPGDKAMDAWKRAGQYEWVGYYLSAPCHSDDTWSGKRAQLVRNGWGLAVIYVGQQTWGKSFAPTTRTVTVHRKATKGHRAKTYKMTRTSTIPVATSRDGKCAASYVNAAQGAIDARGAIGTAQGEGFPNGTVIFLDVEYMTSVPQRMRDYYRAWTHAVLADGRYKPGIYAHTRNASTIYDDVSDEYTRAGVSGDPAFWIAGTGGFDVDRAPTDVGHKFATAWQGLLDVVREHNGVRLPVDISVASVASPSTE